MDETQDRRFAGWRGWPLLLVELAIIAAIFIVDRPGFHLIWFSKTLYLALLAALSLQLRHAWSSLGFRLGADWPKWIAFGLAGGLAMEALELFVTQPLLKRAFNISPDLSDFADVQGNYQLLGIFLMLTWSLAAFGEEFVYRGYLLNRLRDACASLGIARAKGAIALVASSLIFGLAHLYQGPAGIIENALDGLILGALYLASGRRLLVPVLAHGVQDTTDFLLIFAGLYPGM